MNKPFNVSNIIRAKKLRQSQTPAEIKLWSKLRKKQMIGLKFRRQVTLLNYIVDFYCIDLKLAIEIDGMSHDEYKYDYDKLRQKRLEEIGVKFVRLTEFEVMSNIDAALQTIENKIGELTDK
jgi:very-short-patch-repair endonuclease